MKLAYPEWNTVIEFRENRFQIVIIEDTRYYRKIGSVLYDQIHFGKDGFIFSQDDQIVNLNKKAAVILSPIGLDFNDSRIMKKILKELEDIAIEEEYIETQEVEGEIEQYVFKLTEYLDYEIELGGSVDLQTVFKSTGLKLVYDDTDLVTRFVDYLCISHRLMNIELFITFGIRDFFTTDELRLIYKTLSQKKIHMLMFENSMKSEIIEGEDVLIIDSDFCEI